MKEFFALLIAVYLCMVLGLMLRAMFARAPRPIKLDWEYRAEGGYLTKAEAKALRKAWDAAYRNYAVRAPRFISHESLAEQIPPAYSRAEESARELHGRSE